MRRPFILATTIVRRSRSAESSPPPAAPSQRPPHAGSSSPSCRPAAFDSPGAPRPGFEHAFTDRVTGDNGVTGHDVGLCTLITSRELLCHSQVILTTGQLSFQGILHQHDHNTPGTIIGGTGAYNGARGTARITDVNPTTAKVTINLVR